MLAPAAVLIAHAVVAKEATVKLLKRLEHIILLHDLNAVCHVFNAGSLYFLGYPCAFAVISTTIED